MIHKNKSFKNVQIKDLENISKYLIKNFKDIKIWLFEGEMGTGKTTLIKSICTELKVIDNVDSPTYNIINEYKTSINESVYHFDLYRLNSYKEAIDIGFEEYINSDSLCFIEWPKLIKTYVDNALIISLKTSFDQSRDISISL